MSLVGGISSRILEKLYWQDKLSSPEIADIYKCQPSFIRKLLRKYGIKIRTRSEVTQLCFGVNISEKALRELYIKNKMTTYEIAKRFGCCQTTICNKLQAYNISTRSDKESKALLKPRYPQKNFSGNLKEKAYLIGLRKGDLHVYSTSDTSPTVFVHTNSTKDELIQIVEHSFLPYGHIWKSKPAKNGAICIRCSLNRSFNFLLDKKDLIGAWILENKEHFAAFLAGYTDAEGSFCLCGGNGVFEIRAQDKGILHQIRSKLIELGIFLRPAQVVRKKGTPDIRGTINNKDHWGIFIHRKDALLKLIDLLTPYLKHTDKQRRAEIVKNNVLERNKRYNNQKDRRYYKLYLNEGIKT